MHCKSNVQAGSVGILSKMYRQAPDVSSAPCRLHDVSHLMCPDDQVEINDAIRAAIRRARGYADFFGWATNRDLEEQGVVTSLAESMNADSSLFFSSLAMRGRGNDPPDLEALDEKANRIAIEVTELVDGEAIQAFKTGRQYDYAEWNRHKFLASLGALLKAKDDRFHKLKGAPYPGGYVVVVFTDEPELPRADVEAWLQGHTFSGLANVQRAFLLLSYDPAAGRCPYFELARDG